MAKIPFFFHSPTPRFFRDNGFFTNPKNKAFIDWCFERCSPDENTVYHENQKITLKPYQFIFGRKRCSDETGLTEDEVRTQQKRWENYGFLKKAPNKTPKLFTVYEWVLTAFLKDDPQENPQVTPKSPPSNPHNQEDKKKRSKRNHPSIPSGRDEGKTDDFSSEIEKIEVCQGIFLTKEELNNCIAIKGDLEKVKHAIAFIQNSKKRKHPISDWPNALAKWKIENKAMNRIEDNLAYAQKLYESFPNFTSKCGWRCYQYFDNKKDQKGILFEPQSVYGHAESVFISYIDVDFKQKCFNTLKEKGMIPPDSK